MRWVGIFGRGEVGELRGNIMEFLPDCFVFLGDGGQLLGYPVELGGDGDKSLD